MASTRGTISYAQLAAFTELLDLKSALRARAAARQLRSLTRRRIVEREAMTEPWVNFRYEYVSGVGSVFELGESSVEIAVANRGGSDGVVRAYLSQRNTTKFDSGDATVAPGHLWFTAYVPTGPEDLGPYWARIFTTSANLVPSMRVWRTQVENQPPISDVYFAPGDFAVFQLPFRPFPPPPPVGPVEGA
jgi:hypothetical protein